MDEQHDIVIVGGGICGLATALALHRKGISSLVLEKSDTLQAAGVAIGVFENAWRALDQLGVGSVLRSKATPITEIQDAWLHKDFAQVTPCRKEELRCVRRHDLIDTLAENLPKSSIRFGCQIVAVDKDPLTSFPILRIDDGSTIKAKVLIGCDGSKSVIAKSLGLASAKSLPYLAIRGLTSYPDGHNFGNNFLRLRGDNVLLGRMPINDNLVYWFMVWQRPSGELPEVGNPTKNLMLKLLVNYPSEMINMVQQCDLNTLTVSHIWYRAPWQLLFANLSKGTTTVAGDAMHVMGPFLGQGGAAALEDAIVLARCLADAMQANPKGAEGDLDPHKRIESSLGIYVKERRLRVLRLSVQAYVAGLTASPSSVVRVVSMVILKILFGGFSLSHTQYDCGVL